MDLQRIFLFLIFSFSLVLIWDGWQRYEHPISVTTTTAQSEAGVVAKDKISESVIANSDAKIVFVKTDTLAIEINTLGGDIQKLSFLHHPDGVDVNKPFVLFDKAAGAHNYITQTGLLGTNLPNHNTIFTVDRTDYKLTDPAQKIDVILSAKNNEGVLITKTLTFHKNSYIVDISYDIQNNTELPLSTSAYFQFIRDGVEPAGGTKFVPTYTGAAVFTDKEKLQKIDFATIDKAKIDYPKQSDNGWIGILQHYFVAAWLPMNDKSREFFTKKLDNGLYSIGTLTPTETIASKSKNNITVSLYAGPAESNLDKITPGLGLSVDYGWLTIIAKPMFWMMTWLHSLVQNWGLAIILLTVLIKLLFFPLSAASYRSMAKMRVVAPKLEKIKLQYGDDREKLNRAMMDLYKTEKINPLGGCLPVLIQIPVFIALYWSILESVEMRYAPFFGWITDLSVADPYYILPIIMGASMILQSKLNPTPPDPMQAKLMQIMPVVFSVVFFFFPAGLVLYSVVNNVLSIGQQWYITRGLEVQGLAAKY